MRTQFVDCRWELGSPGRGRELFAPGHIPGASFLDVDEDLSDLSVPGAGRHPLPSAERFAAAASRAGIGPGVLVVAYGTMGGAVRLWWLLRHFGHDDCAVLLGGIDVWAGRCAWARRRSSRLCSWRTSGKTTPSRRSSSRKGSTIPRSSSSTRARRTGGGASRTRSTTCPDGSRALSTLRGP